LFILGRLSYKFNLKKIIIVCGYLLITIIISIFVLGIPRLYFIWIILILSFFYKKLDTYNHKYLYYNFLDYIKFDFERKLATEIEPNYSKINSRGFSLNFIVFINYGKTYDWDYWCSKNPFVYEKKDDMILNCFRYYFDDINSITKQNYIDVWELILKNFNLDENEVYYWEEKIRKLYEKKLKLY